MTCPACGSPYSFPHEFGLSALDLILQRNYPGARDCVDCGHLWDDERRVREAQLRELVLSQIRKESPL